jgi:GHH signature containing HNH/Endo VII superfamily nuclease toxin
MNNPLSLTDPTGYASFWATYRRQIAAIAAAAIIGPEVYGYIMGEMIAGYGGAMVITGSQFATASAVAGATSAAAAGFAAGGISGGNVQSAVQGAFTAVAFFGAGELAGTHGLTSADAGTSKHLKGIAAHAAVGCASAAAAGGSCRAGAASAGFSMALTPTISGINHTAGQIAAASVAGAIGSKLGGGSYESGAVTGAFGYLFNQRGPIRRGGGYVRSLQEETLEIQGRLLEEHIIKFGESLPQTVRPIGSPQYTNEYVSLLRTSFQEAVGRAAERGVTASWAEFRDAVRAGQPHPSSQHLTFSTASELLKTGRISGWHVHHQLEVSNFPMQASNPQFMRPIPENLHIIIHRYIRY